MPLKKKKNWTSEDIKHVKSFRSTWSKTDKQAALIAQELLGSSFDITKSNGFMAWKAKSDSE